MLKPLLIAALIAVGATPAMADSNALQQYEHQCGNVLNILPRIVRKEAVAAIPGDAQVSVHNICTGVQLGSFGNAVGLTQTIAANRALEGALRQWGYRADDVVGIEIDGNAVQLYVHRA
jgi:hypothetical protein